MTQITTFGERRRYLASMTEQSSYIDWKQAERRLADLLRGYAMHGRFDVNTALQVLFPLRQRLSNGERTRDLYNSIMSIAA